MTKQSKGVAISSKGPREICMVVGCGKKALYAGGRTLHNKGADKARGYCSAHRHLALDTARTVEVSATWAACVKSEWHPNDWTIQVKD